MKNVITTFYKTRKSKAERPPRSKPGTVINVEWIRERTNWTTEDSRELFEMFRRMTDDHIQAGEEGISFDDIEPPYRVTYAWTPEGTFDGFRLDIFEVEPNGENEKVSHHVQYRRRHEVPHLKEGRLFVEFDWDRVPRR